MKKNSLYALGVLLLGFIALLILEDEGIVSSEIITAYYYGAGLNLINFLIAFGLFAYSVDKSTNAFIKITLFSIVFRIGILLIGVIIIIKLLNIDKTAFIFTFFIIYFIFLLFEIVYYKHRLTQKSKYVNS